MSKANRRKPSRRVKATKCRPESFTMRRAARMGPKLSQRMWSKKASRLPLRHLNGSDAHLGRTYMTCPLYPRKRTCAVQEAMSALGQKRTSGQLIQRSPLAHFMYSSQDMTMSALPPKADMCGAARDVRFGPIADIVRAIRLPR